MNNNFDNQNMNSNMMESEPESLYSQEPVNNSDTAYTARSNNEMATSEPVNDSVSNINSYEVNIENQSMKIPTYESQNNSMSEMSIPSPGPMYSDTPDMSMPMPEPVNNMEEDTNQYNTETPEKEEDKTQGFNLLNNKPVFIACIVGAVVLVGIILAVILINNGQTITCEVTEKQDDIELTMKTKLTPKKGYIDAYVDVIISKESGFTEDESDYFKTIYDDFDDIEGKPKVKANKKKIVISFRQKDDESTLEDLRKDFTSTGGTCK